MSDGHVDTSTLIVGCITKSIGAAAMDERTELSLACNNHKREGQRPPGTILRGGGGGASFRRLSRFGREGVCGATNRD